MVYYMYMDPAEIVKTIDQAYQQAIEALQQLDTEKRLLVAQYIKDLEEKKIVEIKHALQVLSAHH